MKHNAKWLVVVVTLVVLSGMAAAQMSSGSRIVAQVPFEFVVANSIVPSDAKLITDATTDYGKTKINVALGYARIRGVFKIDDADPAQSSVEFRFYPAMSMVPTIAEDGQFLKQWLENPANQTLVCFHSKRVVRTSDGRLQATGDLTVTRVDRNVDATPSEAYAGPVYGPPMIHRVSREETFVFDLGDANGKDGVIQASGSTRLVREDFPQLVKTVVNTYWPTVVQEENCQVPDASEAFSGSQCTGTYLQTAGLPEAPYEGGGEGVGVPQNFSTVVGNHLTILVHMRLTPKGSGEQASAGN
jgi:polyisoprenoid-binding protein YceI